MISFKNGENFYVQRLYFLYSQIGIILDIKNCSGILKDLKLEKSKTKTILSLTESNNIRISNALITEMEETIRNMKVFSNILGLKILKFFVLECRFKCNIFIHFII